VTVLVVLLGLAAAARAGAWTREAGGVYAKLAVDAYGGGDYQDPLTGLDTDLRYRGGQVGLYGEVGLLRAWPVQVVVQVPVVAGTLFFEDARLAGGGEARASSVRAGDGRLGVQAAVSDQRVKVAVAGLVKVPLYDSDAIGAGYPGYEGWFPRPGDGQVDVDGLVLVGGGIPDTRAWVEGAAGWRHRTEAWVGWDPGPVELVDGVLFRASAGVRAGRVGLQLGVEGLVNPQADPWSRQGISAGPSGWVTLGHGLALEARFSADLWTDAAPRGVGGGLGLSWTRE
jgi:hypothetical protein